LLKGRLDEALKKSGQPVLGGWLAAMQPHKGKKLLTYHRNWSYFVRRFGLVVPMEMEPKPGIPPSPGRLTEVIKRIKADKIKVLLKATYFAQKATDLVSAQTDIKVVECAMFPGAQPEVTDYFTLFDNLVKRVSSAFGE
jgi:zinc/manganese transport system substrate-binding protein